MDVLLLSHLFLAPDYFHTYISSYLLSSAPETHPLQFLPRLAHMGLGKMETGSFLREVRFLNREPEPEIDLFAGCWNGPG